MKDDSLPLLNDAFFWAREIDPVQPFTSGVWGGSAHVAERLREQSDIITFHNYGKPDSLGKEIEALKKLGRPLICTEWMNRPHGSTIEACLPVFTREQVGALSWGLVNGKTQTDLPWGHRPGQPAPKVWQHDLFKPDYTPYDLREIELFKHTIAELKSR